jgi:hypothetical protein
MEDFVRKVEKNLRRYKIITKSSLIFCVVFLLITFVFSFENLARSIRGLKKINSIIQNKLSDMGELLEFKDGTFSIKIPHYEKTFFVEASVKQNKSTEISFESGKPYFVDGFSAIIYRAKDVKENWEDMLDVSSDVAEIEVGSFKISENVKMLYSSKMNRDFDKTRLFAKWIKVLKNGNLQGEDLFVKNGKGAFMAKKFIIFKLSDFGRFEGGVMMENEDYKIQSHKLDADFFDGVVRSMLFRKNVVFNQKTGEKTVVYGDNAKYDATKSEIYIYGNVYAYSSKNNAKVKGETFVYNEKTKVGTLQGGKKNYRVNVELEI